MVSSVLIRALNSKRQPGFGLQWSSFNKKDKVWRWHTLLQQQKTIAPSLSILLPKKHVAMLLKSRKEQRAQSRDTDSGADFCPTTKEPNLW